MPYKIYGRLEMSKPHVNKKPIEINWNFFQTKKIGLEWTMNELEKPFRKNPLQKIGEIVKIKVKLPHVNKKLLARKLIFVQTPFSHYFKNRAKKFHTAKPLVFSLHFLFRRDPNHYSNLTSKIMKMCEQILKKRQRPNTIQILWIVKNQEHRNIASLSLQLRSYNNSSA